MCDIVEDIFRIKLNECHFEFVSYIISSAFRLAKLAAEADKVESAGKIKA